jgi:hypothetical protein
MPPLTLFFRFSSETLFFQLFHKSGGSGIADVEAALALAEATRSFV